MPCLVPLQLVRRILDVGVGIGVAVAIGIRNHDWLRDLSLDIDLGSIPRPISNPIPIPTPRVATAAIRQAEGLSCLKRWNQARAAPARAVSGPSEARRSSVFSNG